MTLIEQHTPSTELEGPFVGRVVVPTMGSELAPISAERPIPEVYSDDEYETTLVAFQIPEGKGVASIYRDLNNSGFKQATQRLADVTRLSHGESFEDKGKLPVLAMRDKQGKVIFYDTRNGGVTSHGLQYNNETQTYERIADVKPLSDKDQPVHFAGGTEVMFGWTQKLPRNERGSLPQSSPGPTYEAYSQLLDAIDPRRSASRRRGIGSSASGAIVRRVA